MESSQLGEFSTRLHIVRTFLKEMELKCKINTKLVPKLFYKMRICVQLWVTAVTDISEIF